MWLICLLKFFPKLSSGCLSVYLWRNVFALTLLSLIIQPDEFVAISIYFGGKIMGSAFCSNSDVFVGGLSCIWASIFPSPCWWLEVQGGCWAQVSWKVPDSSTALFTVVGDTHIHYRHLRKGHRERWRAAVNCLSITLLGFHIAKSVMLAHEGPWPDWLFCTLVTSAWMSDMWNPKA